ncbi:MAG TPA: DNA primase, partial [Polyangia bacterium]
MNAQKQFFHCFGCGKSGDVFTFLTEVEGKRFVDVARELAGRAGIELPEATQTREAALRARAEETERAKLVRLHELAAEFYCEQLASEAGARARAYVEKRGIVKAAETFRIGYAPAGWDALTRHLEAKKIPHEWCERAGLVRRRESARLEPNAPPTKATHFDVFVDRVVYALTSPMGEVIGFGGRILDSESDQPKYKNSPETPIYKKGENLFGLHAAKHAMRKSGRALVVEGNFDVMTLHERGIDYAVAPQGTAITEAQVNLLKRFVGRGEVILMLDADPAGRAATLKVIRLFVDADVKVRITQLRAEGGKKVDPDDLARADMPRFQHLLESAMDAVTFFCDEVAAASEATIQGKVAAVRECAPLLRAVRDPLQRDLYLHHVENSLKIDRQLLRSTLRQTADGAARPAPTRDELSASAAADAPVVTAPPRPISPILSKLLSLLSQHAALIAEMTPELLATIPDLQVRALLEEARSAGSFAPQPLIERAAPEIRGAVARAFLSDEFAAPELHPKPILAGLVAKLGLPSDRAALEEQR